MSAATSGRPLVVGITELRKEPGSRRPVAVDAVLDGIGTSTARIVPGSSATVDGEIEAVTSGVVVAATVRGEWEGECRRCLEPVRGELEVRVKEVFEREPVEGETYPLGTDDVDLEPMVREALLLGLPLAPLCRPDCAGPDPERFPTSVEDEPVSSGDGQAPPVGEGQRPAGARDPRWAALDDLDLG